jgi:hypothetical protein
MENIEAKMNTQLAQDAMERQKGVDATALMDGELMLHFLRSDPHKKHLVTELELRSTNGIDESMNWNKLCKLLKEKEKDKRGWFTPIPKFFKENREDILLEYKKSSGASQRP